MKNSSRHKRKKACQATYLLQGRLRTTDVCLDCPTPLLKCKPIGALMEAPGATPITLRTLLGCVLLEWQFSVLTSVATDLPITLLFRVISN